MSIKPLTHTITANIQICVCWLPLTQLESRNRFTNSPFNPTSITISLGQ